MYQIGQFAKLMDISPRMLRHYEKAGIFVPNEIDKKTGYRYYSAHQIPLLKQILLLRDSGFKVEEMAETLRKLKDASFFGNYFVKKTRSIATFNSNGGAKD
ncbi:MerR family transcriptional regulator [Enterococcus faecalis]|nr:MerR family transcriptional regulator [Enterococcus faecalis]